jgi:HSP20 family protein
MADVPVEVKKAAPTETTTPDVWRSFRSEMDRLFDRFGFPSLRRMFDMEPAWRPASSFTFSVPAIDMSEDEKAYKISAELPGLDATDVDVSVSGNMLVLKGEKRQEKEEKEKNYYFPSAPTARSSARSSCRRASIATKSQPTSLKAC